VTFATQGEQEEKEEEKEGAAESDTRKKRLCNKVDKLFLWLYEDLNVLCEWENDEKKRGQKPDKT